MDSYVSKAFVKYLLSSDFNENWKNNLYLYIGSTNNIDVIANKSDFGLKKIPNVKIKISDINYEYTTKSYEEKFNIPLKTTDTNGIFKTNWYISENDDGNFDKYAYVFNQVDLSRLSSNNIIITNEVDNTDCNIELKIGNSDYEFVPTYLAICVELDDKVFPFIVYELNRKILFANSFSIDWNLNGLLEVK